MADEVEMIPVAGAEPPKAKPTLKLPPGIRKPVAGAPTAALKPGLKLPPKPGMATGLKLPPKPGMATGAGLRPGLKLPTQTALKPGVRLPPKPMIRKPGATVAAAPVPKPMEALKSVTQKLKGIPQEIPQQAILHKTGIIADGAMSDAQKEAAKHKTARISLADAMGVAPVKDEAAPMKTIRIKRPINIPTATSPLTPQPAAAPQSTAAPAAAPAAEAATAATVAAPAPAATATSATATSATATQRKTLKIARPGGTAVRPSGKFGVKRPSSATTVAKTAPAAAAAPAAEGEVADIPDIPSTPAPLPVPVRAEESASWVWTLSAIVQLAACGVLGALVWFLYENTQLETFCGGLGWGA